MAEPQQMTAALIGAGMVARTHVAACADARGVRLKGIMSRTRARAEALAPGGAVYADLDAVAADPEVDFAIVVTPPDARANIVAPLAAAGKDILLEKPLGRTAVEARAVCKLCADAGVTLETEDCLFGGAAIDQSGTALPPATLKACRAADAVFLGAVGGPKWDGGPERPEAGLLGIRKALGLFANLRPVALQPGTEHLSPLRAERVKGADLLIVRELTGGLYFGDKEEGEETASDLCVYTREEVERVARVAFEAARGRKGLSLIHI